jgi:hypothetical protein
MKKIRKISRRRFLGETSVAATGLILLPWGCSGSGKGSMKLENPVSISSGKVKFSMSPVNGAYLIKENLTKTIWHSNPFTRCFAEAVLTVDGTSTPVVMSKCQIQKNANSLVATFNPLDNKPGFAIRVTVQPGATPNSFAFSYDADSDVPLENISLLSKSLWTTDTEKGYVVTPTREGLFIPAGSGLTFKHKFDTYAYEGCHMTMAGIVKDNSTALITWDDPYTAVEVENQLQEAEGVKQQVLTTTVVLSKTSKTINVQFCGSGDYITIAKAYKKTPVSIKWQVSWAEKLKQHPDDARMFGASNIKLWSALTRRMNPESDKELSLRVNWTFEEGALVAEHFKNDVKIDLCLFTIGGWIRRGYDNQHPDIMPPAPELGGAEALADCSRRIMNLGYLFCLHDNYQDIYRDSPSWDEKYIMKRPDGSITKGGAWAGGTAYLTCSKTAVDLAKRPQNLLAVRELTKANSYFIDTTYASGLQECFDPNHPLTRSDDMYWKQAISDYAREIFGVFGSECGREWALPHADFFEGITGVSGRGYHDAKLLEKVGGSVIPMFEAVYRDGIAMYGKYGYNINDAADYVLQHILWGRPLHYHNIPSHLYWKETSEVQPQRRPQTVREGYDVFVSGEKGWSEDMHPTDRFIKNTHEILGPLNAITAQMPLVGHKFLTNDRMVQESVFGEGKESVVATVNMGSADFTLTTKGNQIITLPPLGFLIESASFIAFRARNWNGVQYENIPLFTLRSFDNKSIAESGKVRVFHGFGDDLIKVKDLVHTVQKEAFV